MDRWTDSDHYRSPAKQSPNNENQYIVDELNVNTGTVKCWDLTGVRA